MAKMTFCMMVVASTVLAGCVSPRSFVDPGVPRIGYNDLHIGAERLKLNLVVEFQRNGQHFPKGDAVLKEHAARILRRIGLIDAPEGGAAGTIKIVLNNIADIDAARAKGIGTGMTFGLSGSTVMDAYEMTLSVTANGTTATRSSIKHALYTVIGNTELPPGVESVRPIEAFAQVLEQMILRALQDMQRAGELACRYCIPPIWWQGAGLDSQLR